MKLLLPTSIPLAPVLPDGVVAAVYDPDEPISEDLHDAEAMVVWGNSPDRLRAAAAQLGNLQWVQTLSAGADSLLSAGFVPEIILTSGVGLHSSTVAEHTLAMILSLVRRLPLAAHAQRGHRWADEIGGIQPLHHDGPVTTLRGSRVLLWGFGHIAQTIAPLLTSLGAEVHGVARSVGERRGVPVIGPDGLEAELQRTDILVMILPSTSDTAHVLNEQRIAALPDHAYLVNVGRGSTVDERALVEALRSGELAGAALDVTEIEPLPADSHLWDAPGLVLTPHMAGGRPVGADELISHNLSALRAGRSLRNVVRR